MNRDDIIKLAREVMHNQGDVSVDEWIATEKAIREALAEESSGTEQQEPVACKSLCELCVKRGYNSCANAAQTTPIPSPPASKPWVGLTDKEWQEIDASLNGKRDLARIFTRAIEAKLREKNA